MPFGWVVQNLSDPARTSADLERKIPAPEVLQLLFMLGSPLEQFQYNTVHLI